MFHFHKTPVILSFKFQSSCVGDSMTDSGTGLWKKEKNWSQKSQLACWQAGLFELVSRARRDVSNTKTAAARATRESCDAFRALFELVFRARTSRVRHQKAAARATRKSCDTFPALHERVSRATRAQNLSLPIPKRRRVQHGRAVTRAMNDTTS